MSDERVEVEPGASRRALFLGAGAVGATALLAACGTDQPGGGPGAPGATGGRPDAGNQPPDDGGGDTGDDEGSDGVLVSTDEVEVGGGVIIAEESVVVTQPSEGTFKGFSAACTHLGCTVSTVSDGLITCNCHGSQYSIEDGSVVRPAISGQGPLPEVEIDVDGDQITRA
jgi:Rieske Fe-S protein